MNKQTNKSRQSRLSAAVATIIILAASVSGFAQVNRFAPEKITQMPTETASKNIVAADLLGEWWYTAILYADGTTHELRNRQSNLELKADGKYSQNIWAGDNLQGHEGTYTVRGNRLTLDWEGEKEVYTMSFGAGGGTLTLKADDGSGWKLERAKK